MIFGSLLTVSIFQLLYLIFLINLELLYGECEFIYTMKVQKQYDNKDKDSNTFSHKKIHRRVHT